MCVCVCVFVYVLCACVPLCVCIRRRNYYAVAAARTMSSSVPWWPVRCDAVTSDSVLLKVSAAVCCNMYASYCGCLRVARCAQLQRITSRHAHMCGSRVAVIDDPVSWCSRRNSLLSCAPKKSRMLNLGPCPDSVRVPYCVALHILRFSPL